MALSLFISIGDCVMLNVVTKKNDLMGEGELEIVHRTSLEPDGDEYALKLRGSDKLEIKSRYKSQFTRLDVRLDSGPLPSLAAWAKGGWAG